jgi:hypothetical protein
LFILFCCHITTLPISIFYLGLPLPTPHEPSPVFFAKALLVRSLLAARKVDFRGCDQSLAGVGAGLHDEDKVIGHALSFYLKFDVPLLFLKDAGSLFPSLLTKPLLASCSA